METSSFEVTLPQNSHKTSTKLPLFQLETSTKKVEVLDLLEVSSKLLVSNGFYDKNIVEKDKISDYFLSYLLFLCKILSYKR